MTKSSVGCGTMAIKHLDCTLRDGGYYNDWDFSRSLLYDYFRAMTSIGVDIVEVGLRSLKNEGFKGGHAFSTDAFIRELEIPDGQSISVMINANELICNRPYEEVLGELFPYSADNSPVDIVRIASHVSEFSEMAGPTAWLRGRGYQVALNLMQIAELNEQEIQDLARLASGYSIDVLYFADSAGGMDPSRVIQVVEALRSGWEGEIGIHTHDNLGLALSNTLAAIGAGVTWVDSTVTGMGRGPGNALTEELVIELGERVGREVNLIPLLNLIREHFRPMQIECGWGTNPFYYLAGKYGIHPSYIQDMLSDTRYMPEDIVAVIEHLRREGVGKKFNQKYLDFARHIYHAEPCGKWRPEDLFGGREVLILGGGPSAEQHCNALISYIKEFKPLVVALNTTEAITDRLIDVRIACHPVRLLTDCSTHLGLRQPLITPHSMLHDDIRAKLNGKEVFDFGLHVENNTFNFGETHCTIPSPLVLAYALATASSGKAKRILLAGFDGYGADDPRTKEINSMFSVYQSTDGHIDIQAVTPTKYNVKTVSLYGLQPLKKGQK